MYEKAWFSLESLTLFEWVQLEFFCGIDVYFSPSDSCFKIMAGVFDIELHEEDVNEEDSDDDTIEVEEVFIHYFSHPHLP